MLIIMAGRPGTGKTFVAQKLANLLDGAILSKDSVRHALFPPNLVEYSTVQDDFVIDVLLQAAAYIWSHHPEKTIILDGRTFSRAWQRQHVIAFAERAKQKWHIVECVCPDDVAKARLSRPDPEHPAANRTTQLYDEVKAYWQPITEHKVVVSTDSPIDFENIARNFRYLRASNV
jgi:predicted kinase